MDDASAAPRKITVQEYLAGVPGDQDWARREAARCRNLSTDERFDLLEGMLRLAQDLLAGQQPARDQDPFWRHWSDWSLGRPG